MHWPRPPISVARTMATWVEAIAASSLSGWASACAGWACEPGGGSRTGVLDGLNARRRVARSSGTERPRSESPTNGIRPRGGQASCDWFGDEALVRIGRDLDCGGRSPSPNLERPTAAVRAITFIVLPRRVARPLRRPSARPAPDPVSRDTARLDRRRRDRSLRRRSPGARNRSSGAALADARLWANARAGTVWLIVSCVWSGWIVSKRRRSLPISRHCLLERKRSANTGELPAPAIAAQGQS
jgi:hypothetical protein